MTYETYIEVPFLSRCHQSTEGIGILLGSCLLETLAQGNRDSLVVGLIGPLGAGKTVLTRALGSARRRSGKRHQPHLCPGAELSGQGTGEAF